VTALHDYQEMGVAHLRRNDRAGLFFDMGLGKTATVLSALEERHFPVLVIAPKRVAERVWFKEGRKWRPDLRVSVAMGTPQARQRAFGVKAHIYVVSRDNIGAMMYAKHDFKTVVLDELSSFKNRGTVRWRAARAICRQATYVWGLTGTPAPNGLIDLWAQIYLLDEGQRLGKTLTEYRGRYFMAGRQLPSGIITEWIPRPEAPIRIHRLLEDLCVSVDATDHLDLPPVTFNTVEVPLDPATRRVYRKLKNDLVLDLDIIGHKHIASTAAALSNQLAQITAGFLYVHDEDTGEKVGVDRLHSNKIQAVREIIDGTGSPILCFYRFEEERDALLAAFPDEAHVVSEKGVWDAWDRGQVPLLVAHPAAIGHGLNLQDGGHTAIWTTLPWSLEEWDQSNKRLARQGQKHPVMIHVLSSPGTVDEAVRKALVSKADVQQALLEHLESPL
jgi:SNF2 family DNA or RNA helicase